MRERVSVLERVRVREKGFRDWGVVRVLGEVAGGAERDREEVRRLRQRRTLPDASVCERERECVCVFVCVCERERERERVSGLACVCVCVCERDREEVRRLRQRRALPNACRCTRGRLLQSKGERGREGGRESERARKRFDCST